MLSFSAVHNCNPELSPQKFRNSQEIFKRIRYDNLSVFSKCPGMEAWAWPLAHADHSMAVSHLPPCFSSKSLSKTKMKSTRGFVLWLLCANLLLKPHESMKQNDVS